MCYSGKYTEKEVYKKICGNGGLNAYLHTNDFRDMQKMAEEGDEYAALVRECLLLSDLQGCWCNGSSIKW